MIKRRTEKANKCILFAGCSFTWGQGLYFYSGLPSCVEQPYNKYDHKLVNHTQIEQAARLRFPRLVANYFDTAEIVDRVNGGSHQSILKWWNTALFTDTKFVEGHGRTDIPIDDIGLVVMQLTQPNRCSYEFNGVTKAFNDIANDRKHLKKLMKTYNLETFEDYEAWYTNQSLRPVQTFLQKVEEHGVPVLVLTWPDENLSWIKQNSWMNNRFMNLEYKKTIYESMNQMMGRNGDINPELTLRNDYEHFEHPPLDDHPSKRCHKVMAENIIREIEERNLL